jgi:hypothetical protein
MPNEQEREMGGRKRNKNTIQTTTNDDDDDDESLMRISLSTLNDSL